MKFITMALLLVGLFGCASNPKVLMKNCTKIHNDYYECDPIPEKNHRGFDRR